MLFSLRISLVEYSLPTWSCAPNEIACHVSMMRDKRPISMSFVPQSHKICMEKSINIIPCHACHCFDCLAPLLNIHKRPHIVKKKNLRFDASRAPKLENLDVDVVQKVFRGARMFPLPTLHVTCVKTYVNASPRVEKKVDFPFLFCPPHVLRFGTISS